MRFFTTILIIIVITSMHDMRAQPTFDNKLPIPPIIDAREGVIDLTLSQTSHKFNPATPLDSLNGSTSQNGLTSFSYNKSGDNSLTLLGPTLLWRQGEPVHIKVTNNLPQINPSGTDSTTTHWHGVELPGQYDGGPHQVIPRDSTWDVQFNVVDYGSTMWYHPHFHNRTLEQVQMGLSGLIIVEEENDILRPYLPHTYGVDDIPVIIGDIGITKKNSNYELVIAKGKRPFSIVNGVNSPFVLVPPHQVRLRILNGSTRKGIQYGFSTSYENGADNLIPYKLIATDGGYTTEAVTMTSTIKGVGEREEIVIDLSPYALGDTIYLCNLNASMPNFIVGSPLTAPGGGGGDATQGFAFLALVIGQDSDFPNYQPIDDFPDYTVAWEPDLVDTFDIDGCRHKNLVGAAGNGSTSFTIDSLTYMLDFINDTICVNSKEVWTIENKTNVAHPFHIHKIQFRILSITDQFGTYLPLTEMGLNGPKDDIFVYPGWKVRFMGKFSDYPNAIDPKLAYMYHCHILTHEDHEGGGMMHQFVVADRPECEVGSPPACSTVGVDELNSRIMIIHPNPASQNFFIKGESEYQSQIILYDMQGRILKNHTLHPFKGEAMVPLESIPAGIILVKWMTQKGILNQKIIVE